MASGSVAAEWPVQTYTHERAAVSPDDRWLAFSSLSSVVVLELHSRRMQSSHLLTSSGPKHFTGLAFHPSGRFLAATSNDATVKLYDTSNWARPLR